MDKPMVENEVIQVMEKWLLCVDPESHQIYTLNINTNEIQIEYDVDPEYREMARKAIYDIESILKLKTGKFFDQLKEIGNWLTVSKQIDNYRRRKIPSYLLHKQSSTIPTYLCQSTLSLAFANVNSIKLHVKLNKYKQLFDNMPLEASSMENPHIIEIEAGLVTGYYYNKYIIVYIYNYYYIYINKYYYNRADEVIKNVLREIFIRFQIKLQPLNENNQFILQIAGLKEFLTGNHPMLSYDRVRISLRGMKHLEVILTEIEKQNEQSSFFPPIINRIQGFDNKTTINWNHFKKIPVLLWHAPFPLPYYEDAHKTENQLFSRVSFAIQNQRQDNSEQDQINININAKDKIDSNNYASKSHENLNLLTLNNIRSRASTKDRVNDLVSMKNELCNRNLLQIESNVLFSGECDWPFCIRIASLENLMQVLESDSKLLENKNKATYNGQMPPQFITKDIPKSDEQHNVVKKKDQDEEMQQTNHKQVHLKLTKKQGRVNDTQFQTKSEFFKLVAFGGVDHMAEMKALKEKYGLDFIPYLISVQASIYNGCKQLTAWCQAETQKFPFSANPKFYETLTFPGIKISQLPQEARLSFNIILHSAQGRTQILGSTTMYIFDDQHRFRSSMNSLNIWPFYRIDPRMLCMGQYWGLSEPLEKKPKNLKSFVNKNYGRLLIQLDQFMAPMKWSLRDEKQMEELGFSKSAKGQRYYQMRYQYSSQLNQPQKQMSWQQTDMEPEQFGSINSNTSSGQQSLGQIEGSQNQSQSGLQRKSKNTQGSNLYPYPSSFQQRQQQQVLQQFQTNPYENYLNYGMAQEQGTQIRFEGKEERTNHNFGTSFNHIQGSSLNIHGFQNQSNSQLSSQRVSQSYSYQNTHSSSNNNDYISQIYPYKNWSTTPRTEDLAILQQLLKVNPLNRPFYSEQQKFILMICRNHYKTLPYGLQIFLMAIDWDDPEQVREAHNMIKLWTPLSPEDALPLLDAPFADETVRLYAVERVSILSDDELALYMLEFTQALMFEKHLFNPLAELLLERSLQNPWVVGHELFWLLKSQLHIKPSYERYSLLLEQLLMLCGEFRQILINEDKVNHEINLIAQKVKEPTHTKESRDAYYYSELPRLYQRLTKPFSFALDSRLEAKEFYLQECKIMNSKKLPLWLSMKSSGQDDNDEDYIQQKLQYNHVKPQADDDEVLNGNVSIHIANDEDKKEEQINHFKTTKHKIQIIFKNGDDIRQDMLTLQLIKIMDKIWLDAGMDFRMKPYKVIATQDQVGMIEVVRDSQTTETIHKGAGTFGSFQTKSIWNYLKNKNTEPQSFEIATDNFLRSCAGYCVATYILGVGDRHSGNIMLTDTGHLFHIDFGHFLGNFKSKYGIKRERTKFVLTEEMAFVMGGREGELFKKFQGDCTNAYNMVRKHGHFLINIFLMNLSAGMPELQQASHVKYLEDMLSLNISDQEATAKFRQEIITSLNDTWRQIDNFIHNIKRRG